MPEFIQTIIVGAILLLSLGFVVFRLSSRTKALVMNKAPSCHGNGDESCPHCHPGAPEWH